MTAGLWAEEAPPKINLSLRVGAREEGGELHRVASLIAPVLAAADRVIAEPPQEAFCWPRWDKRAKAEPAPAREPSLQILGPFAELLAARLEREGRENSLLAARRAFFAAAEDAPAEALGLAWRLEKRLPPASGFGGGSSDAAATLRLLAPFAPGAALAPAAAALGSDVPAALAARPVWASGTGGELAPVALPETWAVLAWPGRGLSTAEVYQAWDEGQGRAGVFAPPRPPARFDSVAELAEWPRGGQRPLGPGGAPRLRGRRPGRAPRRAPRAQRRAPCGDERQRQRLLRSLRRPSKC